LGLGDGAPSPYQKSNPPSPNSTANHTKYAKIKKLNSRSRIWRISRFARRRYRASVRDILDGRVMPHSNPSELQPSTNQKLWLFPSN
jgi:hypothetical protein